MLFKIIEPTTIQLKFILQSASRSIIVDRLLLFWHLFYMIPTSKIWIRIWIRIRIKKIISCRLRMQTRWVRSGSNDPRSPVRVITITIKINIRVTKKHTLFMDPIRDVSVLDFFSKFDIDSDPDPYSNWVGSLWNPI